MAIAQPRPAHEPSSQSLRVQAVLWNSLGKGSIAYALTELLDNMPQEVVDRKLWCLRSDPVSPHEYDSPALPEIAFRALCKARVPATVQGRLAREVALRSIQAGDIVYMWPPYDLPMIERAQERGAVVVAERTNCMGAMGLEVLTRAYARRGVPLPDGWFPPKGMAEEREQMLQCDYVTAPNPLVTQSLLDSGVPKERILETSYGFNPARLAKAIGIERPQRQPVFAFVGLGIVRKGFDVLLEAWARADIDGTLLIAGHVLEDEIRDEYSTILSRPNIQELGYVADIASVYSAADVFVFPTHEEGGPQVIYEAAACGLASIVSPMGAGRIVRHETECLMIDPLDVDNLAAALKRLAEDEPLRRALGVAAAQRSREFTWSKAATRLYDHFSAIERGRAPASSKAGCRGQFAWAQTSS